VDAAQRLGGATVEALLWAGEHTQHARFDAFARIHPLHGKRLLDVGCGRADLLDRLLARGIKPAEYIGVEAVDAFADAAQAKEHPNCTILRADFVREPARMLVGADVILFSGSLNTLETRAFHDTLATAFRAASEAVVFNFLCSSSLAGQPWLRWHHPSDVTKFARTHTRDIGTLNDYLDGDFTLVMRKVAG
jgi:hypothetical protein